MLGTINAMPPGNLWIVCLTGLGIFRIGSEIKDRIEFPKWLNPENLPTRNHVTYTRQCMPLVLSK
jgi:hypothetical protein